MKRNQTNRIDVAKWHYRWGWPQPDPFSQGSSRLATLGWRTQSLRDWGWVMVSLWVMKVRLHKSRSQPERGCVSVPHVPLIPFDLVSAKQSPQLILKAQLTVVLFLPGDVVLDLLQVELANRKIRIPALPLEICVVRPLLLEPEIGHPL